MTTVPSWWSRLPGTTRFALVVASGMGLAIAIVVASRDKTSAGAFEAPVIATATTAEEVPGTVTREWCGRLGARLEPRLSVQAQAKYPGRDVAAVHDHVLNVVDNCLADVGRPLGPQWRCRWDETFDDDDKCKAIEKAARAQRRRAEEAPPSASAASDISAAKPETTCACTDVRRWTQAHEWLPTKVRATANGEFFGDGCEKWDGPFSKESREAFTKGGPALDKLIADIEALPAKALPGCADGWPRQKMLDTAREIQKARKVWERALESAEPSVADLNQANAATCAIQTRLWKTLDESCGHTQATRDSAKSCGFGCANWSGAGTATADGQEAACKWTTICTLGRWPDGSERTTGAQRFKTKAACDSAGAAFGGVPCDLCRCL